MLSFTRPSVQTELDRFFKALSSSNEEIETITKSAFTQARKKLNPEAFIKLSKSQLDYFDKNAPFKKSWNDSRVIAIDGSLLNLPHFPEIESEFGYARNQHQKLIGARCSFAFDVCNELVIDAKIDRRKSCEKELAYRHLEHLNPLTDIVLCDRGYPCHWLMGVLNKLKFRFCFRLSNSWNDAVALSQSDDDDIDWDCVNISSTKDTVIDGMVIPRILKGLRLVKITLPSGEKEILATNLTDREEYSIDVLKQLYQMRWGVEEGFKILKKVLHVEHFTGRTSIAIKQDFYARVFMMNMASMVRSQNLDNNQKTNKKNKLYRANKTQALAKLKDFLVEIFYSINPMRFIRKMLKILSRRKELVRPDRSFIRNPNSTRRRHKAVNHKGI